VGGWVDGPGVQPADMDWSRGAHPGTGGWVEWVGRGVPGMVQPQPTDTGWLTRLAPRAQFLLPALLCCRCTLRLGSRSTLAHPPVRPTARPLPVLAALYPFALASLLPIPLPASWPPALLLLLQCVTKVQQAFVPTLISGTAFWPAANLFNFMYMPPHLRVAYANVAG